MGQQKNAYGETLTTGQQVLPMVGSVIGNLIAPGVGGYAGRGIGLGVSNMMAEGDAAGAPAGTQASAETNLGGLFQGQGLGGFWNNFLEPQLVGGPSAGQGGGSMGGLEGIMGAQSGAGNYPAQPATGAKSSGGFLGL